MTHTTQGIETAPLTYDEVSAAATALVEAFSRTDTDAYFASFDPDATFVFYPEDSRLENRAQYQELWASWVDSGWRVVACASTDQRIQLIGSTAIFSHSVETTINVAGDAETLNERETIVFSRGADGQILAIHEHLSPVPAASTSASTSEES